MMRSLNKQRGMGFTGVLFIIIFAVLVATIAVRLGPVFLENRGVMRAVNNVMNAPDFGAMRKDDFYKRIEQNFYTNDVRTFGPGAQREMVKVTKNKDTGEKEMVIKYEHEVPFMRNVFFNVKFEEHIPINRTGAD